MAKAKKTLLSAAKVEQALPLPSREAIALRAYEIYLERGGAPGHELEDWTRAEQELAPQNGRRRRVAAKPLAA